MITIIRKKDLKKPVTNNEKTVWSENKNVFYIFIWRFMQKKKKNIYYKKQQKPQTNKQKSPPKQTHQQCIYTLCSNMYKNQTQVNASFDGYNHYGLKFLSIITVFRLNNRIKNNHRFSPGLRSLESSSTYLPPKIFYLRNPPTRVIALWVFELITPL